MSLQTFAELTTTLKALVDLFEETEKYGRVNAKNLIALQTTIKASIAKSDFESQINRGVSGMRRSINTAITSQARQALEAHFLDWARFLNVKESDPQSIIREIQNHFDTDAETVKERDFVFGTPVFTGSPGTTVLDRLNTDRFGQDIESQFAEAKSLRLIIDQNNGARPGQETWRFEGTRFIDDIELETEGSGLVLDRRPLHPEFGFLQNGSFDIADDDAAPTSIQGWEWTGTESTDLAIDRLASEVFLPATTSTANRGSLHVKVDGTLSQLRLTRNFRLDPSTAYRFRVGVNKSINGATGGTITLSQGASSQAFTVAALPGGYSYIEMDLDTDLWPDSFNELDLDIKIDISGLAGGGINFDDAFFGALINFGGGWYDLVPGATAPIISGLPETRADWDDTIASDSKIQKWLSRLARAHLKHSATPTVTDP